jgi:putative salt-induced outer membrane protein
MNSSEFLRISLAALLFGAPATAVADTVTLSNGDRVTGSILESNEQTLKMKTEFLGEVEIEWSAVVAVDAPEKLYVTSGEGQTLVGPVKTEEKSFKVQTPSSGEVAIPISEVAVLRNEDAEQAYQASIERLRNPKLTDFWRGFFDTGLALTAGNAETSSFTNAAGATRSTKRDTIKLYFTSVFAKADLGQDEGSVATANAIRGGSRYELNVSDKLFTFGFVDLEFDEFQDLDLRNVLGGGLGYHMVKNDRMTFDLFGGASYNQEFFQNDITRRSAEIVTGEEFALRLNDRTSLTERLAFYPNMSDTGEFRLQFDTSLTTDIFKWLGWNLTVSDRFLSNPVPGRQKNDVLLTTGVRMVFGAEKLR